MLTRIKKVERSIGQETESDTKMSGKAKVITWTEIKLDLRF